VLTGLNAAVLVLVHPVTLGVSPKYFFLDFPAFTPCLEACQEPVYPLVVNDISFSWRPICCSANNVLAFGGKTATLEHPPPIANILAVVFGNNSSHHLIVGTCK